MPPNLGGFFMVRSYYPSECQADYFDFDVFFFQAEDGIRYSSVTGVQTCALPIYDGALTVPGPIVRRPNIALVVDIEAVRLVEHIGAEASHKLAARIELLDRVAGVRRTDRKSVV